MALIDRFGWQDTLFIFAAVVLLILPLSFALAAPRGAGAVVAQPGAPRQSVVQALAEAFGHTSYVLLVLGFFTCGFQIFFIAVHLPAYLVDRGLPAEIGGWAIATIGLFNIVGAISAGWISNLMPKRYLLSLIYFGRAVAILVYHPAAAERASTLVFAAVLGATLAVHRAAYLRRWSRSCSARAGSPCCSASPSSAIRSAGSSGSGSAASCSNVPDPTTRSGGSRSCSALLSAAINLPIVEKPVVRPVAVPG